jgi:hypothetical protein
LKPGGAFIRTGEVLLGSVSGADKAQVGWTVFRFHPKSAVRRRPFMEFDCRTFDLHMPGLFLLMADVLS